MSITFIVRENWTYPLSSSRQVGRWVDRQPDKIWGFKILKLFILYIISSINSPGVLLFSHLKSKLYVPMHSVVLFEGALLFYAYKQLYVTSFLI